MMMDSDQSYCEAEGIMLQALLAAVDNEEEGGCM